MSSISIRRARKLGPNHQALLEWVQAMNKAAKRFRFRIGGADVILKHGRFFTPQKKPDWLPWEPTKMCFMNASRLALGDAELTYVEGFADSGLFPTEHAWAVDRQGRVLDNTWREPGVVYLGVPFTTWFLRQSLVANGYYGIFGAMGKLPHVFTLKPDAIKRAVKLMP